VSVKTLILVVVFQVGPSLMAAPVLQPAAVSVTIYLPNATNSWFHLQGGERVAALEDKVTLLAPENELILLIRGGHIIPMQVKSTFCNQIKSIALNLSTPRKPEWFL